MNIVVICENECVEIYKNWRHVEKVHPQLSKDDFQKHGNDWVTLMDKESYQISKDIGLLESVASEAIFGKRSTDWKTVFMTSLIVALVVIFFK